MSISKKHLERIAQCINILYRQRDTYLNSECDDIPKLIFDEIISNLSSELRLLNPNFDADRFREACTKEGD